MVSTRLDHVQAERQHQGDLLEFEQRSGMPNRKTRRTRKNLEEIQEKSSGWVQDFSGFFCGFSIVLG